MTNKEILEITIKALSAMGTLIIATLAIFGPTVKKWFYKVKLTFHIDSKEPFVIECNSTEMFSSDINKSLNINIQIKNTGNITAINTQLYVEKIFRIRQENQTYYLDKEIIPSNFYWKDDSEIKSLTPLMSHYLEIAKIESQVEYAVDEETKSETKKTRDLLFLSVPDSTNSGQFIKLGKGTYIIPVKAYSDNLSKEIEFYIELFWNANDLKSKSTSNFYVKQIKKTELPKEIIKEL